MKNSSKLSIILFAIIIVSMCKSCGENGTKTTVVTDTIPDTVYINSPVAHDTIYVDKPRIVRVPLDEIFVDGDSVYILETITKHYHDSTYDAWVSGVGPMLDSIHVYKKTIVKTITKTIPEYVPYTPPTKAFGFGGFVSGQTSFDINHINLQGGLEVNYKNLYLKGGYNLGDYNYPFIGVEYKFR